MKRIAHISDLHFGRADTELVLALAEELDRFEPDLIVVTGDLTQRATRTQFEQARGFLDSLPFARLVVPGNHDIAPLHRPIARAFNPYGCYARYFPPALNSFFADDEILVIGLNTVQPMRWKEGGVTEQQIAWIEDLVARHPDKLHVLAAHHPLVHIEDRPLEHRIRRLTPLLSMFERVGVDLVLSGHLHESYSGHAFGVMESLIVAQASTATSTRLRGHHNAYNRITIEQGRVEIELYSHQRGRFAPEQRGNYEKQARLWSAWRLAGADR